MQKESGSSSSWTLIQPQLRSSHSRATGPQQSTLIAYRMRCQYSTSAKDYIHCFEEDFTVLELKWSLSVRGIGTISTMTLEAWSLQSCGLG